MTSIAIAYNKLWIAIAADSAATTNYWLNNSVKIFNANKIFRLSNISNIWVWIYQSANLWTIPWEIIIWEYRRCNRSFASVEDYVKDFLRYIEQEAYIPDEDIQTKMQIFINKLSRDFNDFITNKKNWFRWIVTQAIEQQFAEEFFSQPLFWEIEWKYPICLWNNDDFISSSINIDPSVFKGFLEENKANWLLKFIDQAYICFKNFLNYQDLLDNYTWLVFVWYWESEYFPKVYHIKTKMKFNWKLFLTFANDETNKQEPHCWAEWYADSEVIHSTVLWFNSRLRSNISILLEDTLNNIWKKIKRKYNIDVMNELLPIINTVNSWIDQFWWNEVSSFIWAINFLSLSELWDVVETLVNITSFKKRVSNKVETVWWKTDVAVISKSDGFVWVKKKDIKDV